jgi:oxygen-dependent protoporphyrinogen oxidase
LPIDPLGFFTSGFFSVRGRLRLLLEPFIPRRLDDESVADFIRRRFGRELLDYVFDPLVGGLYAGDPEKLSISALLPRLKQLETHYGSVVRGAARKMLSGMDARYDPRRRMLFSFRDGMATLPHRLAAALGKQMRSGVRVEGMTPLAGGGFRLKLRTQDRVEVLHADQVVVALPAYAAARLLEPLSPDSAAALANIEHPPLAVVGLGYRRRNIAHPLDGLGALTPTVERRNILGFLFSSTLFAGRAPEDHALLTAYVGGARQPELACLSREDLIALVRSEAADLLDCRGVPVFESVRYWQYGLPQPDLAHPGRMQQLSNLEDEFPGLVVTGNYVAGVSTATCIDTAVASVDRLIENIGSIAAIPTLAQTAH